MADWPLFECLTTDLDNLSKKPFLFLTDSFGVKSWVLSGDKNAPSNDETEEDLVCLPDEGPLAVAPELSPLGVRNTSVLESEFFREFFPTTINEEIKVKRTSLSQDLRWESYLRPVWSRTYEPGDKVPPSACGMRLGVYLRLEWSRTHISLYHNTCMPALYTRTPLTITLGGSISPIFRPMGRMMGCTHTPSLAGSGAWEPCIYQSAH